LESIDGRLLLVASVPSTLWAFYRRLPEFATAAGIKVAVASSAGAELDIFRKELGLDTFAVAMPRRISPLTDLRSVGQLVKIMRRERIDLVHAMSPKGGLVGMLAARRARVPHRVYSMLGLPAETARGLMRRVLIATERLTCGCAHRVLACSASLAREAEALGIVAPSTVGVLGDGTSCGVDLRRFTRTAEVAEAGRAKRRALGIPDDGRVIGFVGRLVRDKGIDATVEAFERLAANDAALHLLLLGDYEPSRGEVRPETVRLIAAHPRIHHVPFDWEPVPYYAAMDLLILATHREGFPYALLEAAAMELPVVATRATGCVDAVVDGQTGILVPVGDVAALADGMWRVAEDAALRRRFGRAARERVERCFRDERLLQLHVDLYRELLGLSPQEAPEAVSQKAGVSPGLPSSKAETEQA